LAGLPRPSHTIAGVLARLLRLLRPGEGDRRQRFFAEAGRYTQHVSVEAEGFTFLVPTGDAAAGDRFFKTRSGSEFAVLRRACERIPPHGVFVDVGANIGTTTLPALRYFERALAVEAEPRNASLLRANVVLNALEDRVVVREAACSSHEGEVELLLSAKHGGHAVGPAKPGAETLHVPAARLDTLVGDAGLGPTDVGLVWMDVGGYEEEVLRGAASLLDARVPLVVEIRARTAPAVEAVLAQRYSSAVDLRDEVELPLARLADHLKRLAGRGGRKFTDVLLLP
jgi:FkbM family methyltransferase